MCLTAMTAGAQITPEAIYGLCPPFPSQEELVGYKTGYMRICATEVAAVEKYLNMLDAAIRQSEEAIAKWKKTANIEDKAMADANKAIKKELGISIDEAQNMDESELEKLGMSKANSMLKKMGIKKSAEELGSQEELSEAEQQQIAEDMTKNMTGMSVKELEALEKKLGNMSEEEQMAYMQSGGKAQKMIDKAKKVKRPAATANAKMGAKFQYSDRYMDIFKELQALNEGENAFRMEIEDKWVASGYEARCRSMDKELAKYEVGDERELAIEDKLAAIKMEFYRNESVKEWTPRIMKELSLMKQLPREVTPNYEHMSDYEKEVYRISQAENAIEYLRTAKWLVDAPSAGTVRDDNDS